MEFNQIKLIIWDLDETLWNGILSEEEVFITSEIKQLIIDAVDSGVMCSICSKNDEENVKNVLLKEGLSDYFVFNSINWSPKGDRVNQIIKEMNLRPVNVMFVDDNPLNRQEALMSCPGLTAEDVDVIPLLVDYFKNKEKKDLKHKRLEQYRILEKKKEFQALAGSNIRFLEQSNIKVETKNDCINHIDRIHDLVSRSNQLNFTKIRSTKEELIDLFSNKDIKCAYVEVSDNFGDYGIVGFYALQDNELLHFTFSCRTLGMGIEQYVYKQLGKPSICVVGEVSSKLDEPDPYWINTSSKGNNNTKVTIKNGKIVIKGLCDMQQMFAYIAENDNIITEFEYVNKNGVSIEQRNHTEHIVESLKLSDDKKAYLAESLPFGDSEMFTTALFDNDIDYIVLSLFTDPNLGMYQDKNDGTIVCFGEYTNDLTDKNIWSKLINKELFVANCNFTIENLTDFSNRFNYLGRISIKHVIENLDIIYSHINTNAVLILVLGSEKVYPNETKKAYLDRHIYHKELNNAVKEWKKGKNNVEMLDINSIATTDSDYTNNINHFSRNVYFKMSEELISIIEKTGGNKLKQNGEFVASITHLKRKFSKLMNIVHSLFNKK